MFEVKYNPNVPEQDHHDFIYKDGKKIPKVDTGLRYVYLDKAGLFHASKWEDEASEYGKGVYAVTDEVDYDDGFPVVNKKIYKVWGATEYAVYLSKRKEEPFHVKEEKVGNKVIVPHNDKKKMADLEIIRKMYLALEEMKKSVGI